MEAQSDTVDRARVQDIPFDFEATFQQQFARVARVIARVVRDPSRAEELAVEVFVKLWRTPKAQGEGTQGWLYRTAVRKGLDELRRQTRRSRYQHLLRFARPATPEEIHTKTEDEERVRSVLAALHPRQAELLLLHSHGLSYQELSSALSLNPASIGTLLSRAQQTFRKEHTKRYGQE